MMLFYDAISQWFENYHVEISHAFFLLPLSDWEVLWRRHLFCAHSAGPSKTLQHIPPTLVVSFENKLHSLPKLSKKRWLDFLDISPKQQNFRMSELKQKRQKLWISWLWQYLIVKLQFGMCWKGRNCISSVHVKETGKMWMDQLTQVYS